MKYLVVGLFALSLLATAQFAFGEGRKVADVLKNPIEMKDASSSRMNVVFNHSSHKGINCLICHHMETIDGDVFVPCTNEECHATPGARERDTMSLFMAYHDQNAEQSCYGCHKREAASHPDFKGCRPCHISPLEREAVAAK